MIKLGEKQILKVKRKVEIGVYLASEDEGEVVLLPNSQYNKDLEKDDEVEVFVYKDSEDRIIATTRKPKIKLGEIRSLKVIEETRIGAFLDWGLDKDLLLPFKEQRGSVKKGEYVLVTMYIDKTERLTATMKIYNHLESENPYSKDDKVSGMVYDVRKGFGALVAVDGKYHGLIFENELFQELKIGSEVECRVINKKKDGKLDLSLRRKAYRNIDGDAKKILETLKSLGGYIEIGDKSSPEEIKKRLNMSKNAFKKGAGKLFKERLIIIDDYSIKLVK